MQNKFLVMLAGLLVMAALVVIVSCAPAPAAPVKETVVVQQTVVVPATAAPQPTAAPAATAAAPTPKPLPPVATLKIVPVAATALDSNVLTATLGATTTIYLGVSGLSNTSVGVPVHLSAVVADAKNPAKKFAWTLTAPTGSKSALKDPAAASTEFTPDVVGMYKVDVVPSNDAGAGAMSSVQVHADTYIGVTAGNCKQCHPDKFAEWSKTGHSTKFTREIDGSSSPATSHYAETCVECHTTGYYPGAKNGGFADVQAKTGWKFPPLASIQSGKGNWDAVPPDLKNVANIQCEVCHGPANEHVTKGANVMAVSMDEGVCDVCHAVPTHHTKGNELANSKHSNKTETAWNYPTGADHQDCVRCHSGNGYVSFLDNPKDKAAWNNTPQTPSCATCHDPHNDTNKFQLRIVGKPVQLPFDNPKDAGLSATCEECHNGRQKPEDALKGQFPHYSSIAEMMNGVAGVTYGQTISDSPHGMIVGAAAMPDPADKTGKTMLYGGVAPGPCVTCHMQPILADAKDPNVYKVGDHSFNTATADGKFDYTAVCQTCHGAAVKDFDFKAKADYDGNGKVEGVQDEVKGMLDVLWKALADKGLKKTDSGYPYATLPKDASGNTDPKILNAWYNFRVVYGVMWGTGADGKPTLGNQGAAQAIHNFKRSVSLLQLSYKDLTGKDVPNATLIYK